MWFWYSLLAAVLSGLSITLNKQVLKNSSASLTAWALFSLNIPILALIALRNGPPQINLLFLVGVVGSATQFAIGKTLALSAIKQSALSQIIPLNAFSVVVTYLLGLVMLTESAKLVSLLGLLLVALGAYSLNAVETITSNNLLQPFKILFTQKHSRLFLLGVLLSGTSAVFDKIALVNISPSNPAFTLLAENLIISSILFAYLTSQKPGWTKNLKASLIELSLASTLYGLTIVIAFTAFQAGPIALAVGVKKLQILFAIFFSFLFFKDKPSKNSLLAAILMILGATLIKLE